MKKSVVNIMALLSVSICSVDLYGGAATRVLRETGEVIFERITGKTAREIGETAARYSAKYGDEAAPFLRRTGHVGAEALEYAGKDSPKLLRLFRKNPEMAVWLASRRQNLSMFLRYGEDAAKAMYKHPGIAERFIGKYSDDAVVALNKVSRRGAQRMGILESDGVFSATPESRKLLGVVREYGDAGLDFIWRHKGVLAGGVLLAAFVHDPKPYIDGAKELVAKPVTEGVLKPIVKSVNWTLVAMAALVGVLALILIGSNIIKKRVASECAN